MSRRVVHYGGLWRDAQLVSPPDDSPSPCGANLAKDQVALLWRNVTCKRCLRWRATLQAWEAKENCEA